MEKYSKNKHAGNIIYEKLLEKMTFLKLVVHNFTFFFSNFINVYIIEKII